MATTVGFPSGYNTFVPSFDATGKLVVSFSRNAKDFALNRYVTLTPVKKSIGYYLNITAEQAARVLNTDISDSIWHDGNDAPHGEWGVESFNFLPFATQRFVFPFRLGYKAVDQADWNIIASHAAIAAQQAMTARTLRVLTLATNQANYAATHVNTATALGGAFWSAGTPTSPAIRKGLLAAAEQIQIDTLGKVKPKDLCLVLSPDAAIKASSSSEVSDYLKNSPFALAQVRGDAPNQNGEWGLPDTLYSIKIVVEDAVRVPTHKNAANVSRAYILGNNQAVLCARPGELVGFEGSPSFGSFHIMAYEEMSVEQRDDPDNRRVLGRVVDDYDVQFVAPASAYLITNLFS